MLTRQLSGRPTVGKPNKVVSRLQHAKWPEGKHVGEGQNSLLLRLEDIARGAEKERLEKVVLKKLNVRRSVIAPNPVTCDLEHAKWLEHRQVVERHNSLLRRLEGLAQDAQIERLDKAAELLRQTAGAFRNALREKYE